MFDIGWMELLVIGVVALIVVGPKDLPGLFRTAGQFMGKARGMAREFQRSMEAAANESGLSESAKQLNALNTKLNLNSATASARRYAESAVKEPTPAKPAAAPPAKPDAEPAPPSEAPDKDEPGPIFTFLATPLTRILAAQGQAPEMIYTGMQQGFMTQVRISMFGGFVLA